MKKICLILIGCLISTQVFASLPPIMGGLTPPSLYDHPYAGQIIVKREKMPYGLFGFTMGSRSNRCIIHLNRRLVGVDRQQIIRHETAHCNGWPANHMPPGSN